MLLFVCLYVCFLLLFLFVCFFLREGGTYISCANDDNVSSDSDVHFCKLFKVVISTKVSVDQVRFNCAVVRISQVRVMVKSIRAVWSR